MVNVMGLACLETMTYVFLFILNFLELLETWTKIFENQIYFRGLVLIRKLIIIINGKLNDDLRKCRKW